MIRVVQALALAAAVMLPTVALAQKPSLKNPASLNEKAPDVYKAKFDRIRPSQIEPRLHRLRLGCGQRDLAVSQLDGVP